MADESPITTLAAVDATVALFDLIPWQRRAEAKQYLAIIIREVRALACEAQEAAPTPKEPKL